MSDISSQFKKLSLSEASEAPAASGLSAEQQALESQWLTLSKRIPESLDQFNESLKSTTYLLGNSPSSVDAVVFARALPELKKISTEQYPSTRHLLRWADLVQNTVVDVPASEQIVIDYSVELPREIKEKPKKDAVPAAKAPSPAPAAKAEKKDDKPKGKPDEETLKKLREEAQKAKKEKKAKKAAEDAKKATEVVPPNPGMIDLRVGYIQKAVKHPDADSLYVSTIECGDEEGPRTVCSGLVKYFPLEAMQGRYVVVVANLKPVNMRGVKSTAMVLCGSDEEHGAVEFVDPPAGSKAGEKVFFEGYNSVPEKQLNPKKKVWEAVQPGFTTLEDLQVVYKLEGKPDAKLTNERGEEFKVKTLVNACVR